jgi:hypothetical protein
MVVTPHRSTCIYVAAALLLAMSSTSATAEPGRVDNIKEVFERFRSCWQPPPSIANREIDVTVVVSFTRDGNILGRPRITHESERATDNDRLMYRIAVMEALQRCTPMPFTEGMAGAVAGRPFAIRFQNREHSPRTPEKRAWLTTKIL